MKTPFFTRRRAVMPLVCAAGALLNVFFCHVLRNVLGIPLFLDTVLTMTLTFYGGLFWGVLTGALTNLILHSVFFYGWAHYLYTFCNMAVALVTAFFIRRFPADLSVAKTVEQNPQSRVLQSWLERVIILMLLSFALCVVMSVMGGCFAVIIQAVQPPHPQTIDPESNFKLALVRKHLPPLLAEICSRILVNIPDRLISSFAGYGIAVLISRAAGRIKRFFIKGK